MSAEQEIHYNGKRLVPLNGLLNIAKLTWKELKSLRCLLWFITMTTSFLFELFFCQERVFRPKKQQVMEPGNQIIEA